MSTHTQTWTKCNFRFRGPRAIPSWTGGLLSVGNYGFSDIPGPSAMSCARCPGLNTLYSISCIRLLPACSPPNSQPPIPPHYPFAGTQECSSWNVYLCAFVPCVQLFPAERSACVQYYKIIFKPHSESRNPRIPKSPTPRV